MSWLQLTLCTNADHSALIEEVLTEAGALAITLTDPQHNTKNQQQTGVEERAVLEPAPGATVLWSSLKITGLFAQDTDITPLVSQLNALKLSPALQITIAHIAEQNWIKNWADDIKAMSFGTQLWIVPTFLEPPDPDAINIMLDPGLAFGSGSHATTRLCLEWLEKNAALFSKQTVIDYGCGCGILAIAASKLGSAKIWAIDYDDQAITATHNNLVLNNIDPSSLVVVTPDKMPSTTVTLIIANILANTLCELYPLFVEHQPTQGHIVLSGILSEQEEQVKRCYATHYQFKKTTYLDGWCCLHGVVKNN